MLACDLDAQRREGRPLPAHGYLTLHEARHTYCSTALAAGVSPAAVSRYAGHASVAFTLGRYVKALAGTEAGDAAPHRGIPLDLRVRVQFRHSLFRIRLGG